MLRYLRTNLFWSSCLGGISLILGNLYLANLPAAENAKEVPPFPVSPVQEAVLGQRAFARFMKDRFESADLDQTVRINRIGDKLAKVCDRPTLIYEFTLIKGDELQAWSFPGGSIVLTEALASSCSDDELAFTIGHELAHTSLRHHIQQTRFINARQAGLPGEQALLEVVSAAFKKDHALEADRFGVLYSVRAGYSFTASYASLRQLKKATEVQSDDAHPDYKTRIAALEAFRKELELSVQAFHAGVKALRIQDVEEAISLFTLFAAEFPTSVSGRVNLGLAYVARMESAEFLAEVLEPLRDPGVDPSRDAIIDLVAAKMARANFERAIRIQPDSGAALAGLGLVHTRLREYEKARERFLEAKENVPVRWDVLLCLGNVEYLENNYHKAVSYYRQARAMKPESAEIKKNLALALEETGNRAEAEVLWKDLLTHPHIGREAVEHLPSSTTTAPTS